METDEQPRPPKHCPRCKYLLAELKHDGFNGVCPECGLSLPLRVPDFGRPMRCSHCRTVLTGMPIFAMRVRCPTCGLLQWWRGPARRQRSKIERIFIIALVVIAVIPAGVFLLSFVLSLLTAGLRFGP